MIEVYPKALQYELLLTAETAISHHDPAVQDDSNRNLFNRKKQLMPALSLGALATPEQMAALAAAHPVPVDVAGVMEGMTFPEFTAITLTRLWLDLYNSQNGEGLFEGMERYSRLEARLRTAAICTGSLRAWWGRLCREMQVGIHGGSHDLALLDLLSVPAGTQQTALRMMTTDYRTVVTIARTWHTVAKLANEGYAEKAGRMAMIQPLVTLVFAPSSDSQAGVVAIDVPAVSGNSLRHQVVREPSWLYLMARLGLAPDVPGRGPVPAGVEAIFYNGGNIESGAKQPSNVFGISHEIRARYPSLDLLGGVTDSFDIGESRLRVEGILVCRENREALEGSPAYDLPAARMSVFDMLDDVTETRQAGTNGLGQMIHSFETLASGVQVLCRIVLQPFTPALTRGALVAACDWFLAHDRTIGGQAARGFGWMRGEWLGDAQMHLADAVFYGAYLGEHRDELVEGLVSGTLGTKAVILT